MSLARGYVKLFLDLISHPALFAHSLDDFFNPLEKFDGAGGVTLMLDCCIFFIMEKLLRSGSCVVLELHTLYWVLMSLDESYKNDPSSIFDIAYLKRGVMRFLGVQTSIKI